jgi:hypothetical protein
VPAPTSDWRGGGRDRRNGTYPSAWSEGAIDTFASEILRHFPYLNIGEITFQKMVIVDAGLAVRNICK